MTRKRFDSAPQFNVKEEGVLIQQVAGSTVPLLDVKNHTGNSVMTVDHSGTMTASLAPEIGLPAGMLAPYAGASAPAGWLLCAGQTVSRTTYAALFAAIGTQYNTGGEAGTDFRLPDLRGRTIAGIDNMGGSDAARLDWANTLGTAGGAQTHTLTSAESGVPAHSHPNTATFTGSAGTTGNDSPDHAHLQRSGGSLTVSPGPNSGLAFNHTGSQVDSNMFTAGASARHQHTFTPAGTVTMTNANNTAATASSAHNNMQPTILLNYIIKH